MTGALISIKPKYSNQIFEGSKTVEFRRKSPALGSGEIIVIYETSPTMAIRGFARVRMVETDNICTLWGKFKKHGGIDELEFMQYAEGSSLLTAIVLYDPTFFLRPITLVEVRSIIPAYYPPQSWCYLDNLPKALLARVKKSISYTNHRVKVV